MTPAATYLESEDLHRSYGTYYMQLGQAVVPPQGEARTNRALAAELARRLDVTDAVFSMSGAVTPVIAATRSGVNRGNTSRSSRSKPSVSRAR